MSCKLNFNIWLTLLSISPEKLTSVKRDYCDVGDHNEDHEDVPDRPDVLAVLVRLLVSVRWTLEPIPLIVAGNLTGGSSMVASSKVLHNLGRHDDTHRGSNEMRNEVQKVVLELGAEPRWEHVREAVVDRAQNDHAHKAVRSILPSLD